MKRRASGGFHSVISSRWTCTSRAASLTVSPLRARAYAGRPPTFTAAQAGATCHIAPRNGARPASMLPASAGGAAPRVASPPPSPLAGSLSKRPADLGDAAAHQRARSAHMPAAAELRHHRGRVDRRCPGRGAARDLDSARVVLVEQERHAHAARARDLLHETGDVLVQRLGVREIVARDLGPHELILLLAPEP